MVGFCSDVSPVACIQCQGSTILLRDALHNYLDAEQLNWCCVGILNIATKSVTAEVRKPFCISKTMQGSL